MSTTTTDYAAEYPMWESGSPAAPADAGHLLDDLRHGQATYDQPSGTITITGRDGAFAALERMGGYGNRWHAHLSRQAPRGCRTAPNTVVSPGAAIWLIPDAVVARDVLDLGHDLLADARDRARSGAFPADEVPTAAAALAEAEVAYSAHHPLA